VAAAQAGPLAGAVGSTAGRDIDRSGQAARFAFGAALG